MNKKLLLKYDQVKLQNELTDSIKLRRTNDFVVMNPEDVSPHRSNLHLELKMMIKPTWINR